MKTYSARPSEVTHSWWLIDAEDVVLGRLASIVANMLRGKHKPQYTPHIDCGDHIVVINRVKPHTAFRSEVESGLCKILAIGCGRETGAADRC